MSGSRPTCTNICGARPERNIGGNSRGEQCSATVYDTMQYLYYAASKDSSTTSYTTSSIR